MKFKQLVINGCSYSHSYASGNGHVDLANSLGISLAQSLAIGGSANSRIIRSTLKHSYTKTPTLYIVGITFVSRSELPILKQTSDVEGRWINPQNYEYSDKWEHNWTSKDTEVWNELRLKTEVYSMEDRLEDLMYRILPMITDVQSRGHQILVHQQADNSYQQFLSDDKFQLLKNNPNIIDGLNWCAIGWQHENKVPARQDKDYDANIKLRWPSVPDNMRHPLPGHHQKLNEYLSGYIINKGLL